MRKQRRVERIELRLVQVGPDHALLEIVEDGVTDHATEGAEGGGGRRGCRRDGGGGRVERDSPASAR